METFSYWSFQFVQFFLCFHWSPSIGKPRLTPVSFVKTTESYEVSLVTINRQTSYESGTLHQNYEIIRGFIKGQGSRRVKIGPVTKINEIWLYCMCMSSVNENDSF